MIEDQGAHVDEDQSEETSNQAPTSTITALSQLHSKILALQDH